MRSFLKFIPVALILSLAGCGFNGSPGRGEKVGQIVKVNRQGLVSKTWEAELIRGGLSGGSGALGGQPFDFTIPNEEMALKAQEYLQNQTEVLLKYEMSMLYMEWNTDSSGHFAVSIEPAKK